MSTIIGYLTRNPDALHLALSDAAQCGDATPEPLVLLAESDAELAGLRAECERLRAALTAILDAANLPECPSLDKPTEFALAQSRRAKITDIRLAARAALTGAAT